MEKSKTFKNLFAIIKWECYNKQTCRVEIDSAVILVLMKGRLSKMHLHHKQPNQSSSAWTHKRNLEARSGSLNFFTSMPTAEESEVLKAPTNKVRTLINSVVLSVKLDSSVRSCQVINDHISKYNKLPQSWKSKNCGF